jgi:hypothetical protein
MDDNVTISPSTPSFNSTFSTDLDTDNTTRTILQTSHTVVELEADDVEERDVVSVTFLKIASVTFVKVNWVVFTVASVETVDVH